MKYGRSNIYVLEVMTDVNLKKKWSNVKVKRLNTNRKILSQDKHMRIIKAIALTIQMLSIKLKYSKVGQTQQSRSLGQKCWFPWNGSVTINTQGQCHRVKNNGTHGKV